MITFDERYCAAFKLRQEASILFNRIAAQEFSRKDEDDAWVKYQQLREEANRIEIG